jgi:hypothetical protein
MDLLLLKDNLIDERKTFAWPAGLVLYGELSAGSNQNHMAG